MREKSTRWMLTLWDFNDANKLRAKKHLCNHIVVGEEICPTTEKLHFHAYVEFKKQYDLSNVKSIFKTKEIHCEMAKKCAEACIQYCMKQHKCFFAYKEPSSESSSDDIFDVFDIKIKPLGVASLPN